MADELPKKYTTTNKKGKSYEVTPLAFLKNVPGLPPVDKIEGSLQIRNGMIVAMKSCPKTEEEKKAREAELKKERKQMAALKEDVLKGFKMAKERRDEELSRIRSGAISAIPQTVEENFQDKKAKWDAVRSCRTLEQTREALQ